MSIYEIMYNTDWEGIVKYLRPDGNVYTKVTFYKDGNKISCIKWHHGKEVHLADFIVDNKIVSYNIYNVWLEFSIGCEYDLRKIDDEYLRDLLEFDIKSRLKTKSLGYEQ